MLATCSYTFIVNAHLLIEVGRPREVCDGGIDAPPEILEHHSGGCMRRLEVEVKGCRLRACCSRGVLWGIRYGGAGGSPWSSVIWFTNADHLELFFATQSNLDHSHN